jgi:hypothetical protein
MSGKDKRTKQKGQCHKAFQAMPAKMAAGAKFELVIRLHGIRLLL